MTTINVSLLSFFTGHYFRPISKHTDARFLHFYPLTNSHFKFLVIIELTTFQVSLERHRHRGGWSRSFQWNDYSRSGPPCGVSGCTVMLKGHISRQIGCLGRWRNTWEFAACTVMRKCSWLFMTCCEGSIAWFVPQWDFQNPPQWDML
jgi:hypothetical protein